MYKGVYNDEQATEGTKTYTHLEQKVSCPLCGSEADCVAPKSCVPYNGLCYETMNASGTTIEAGCALPVDEILYDRGVRQVTEALQVQLCEEENCNQIGSEDEFMPTIECTSGSLPVLASLFILALALLF